MTTKDTEQDTDTCPRCPAGELVKSTTTVTFSGARQLSLTSGGRTPGGRGGPPRSVPVPVVVVTEVPAEVCDTCGETVVDSETTSRVLELAQDARYHWNRDSENLKGDGVVIGGEPGKDGGIIRVDFDTPTLPADRVVTSGQ